MLMKKEGIINGIIYDNTVYHNGEYRIYPTLIGLRSLINEIIESKSTTNFLRFTPFYMNAKLNQQIEFDDYMFYIECRDKFDDRTLLEHIGLCLGKDSSEMSEEELRLGRILFPLCKNNDIVTYKKLLEAYDKFLCELIPKLMGITRLKMDLNDKDLAFGYFCFEVHSE